MPSPTAVVFHPCFYRKLKAKMENSISMSKQEVVKYPKELFYSMIKLLIVQSKLGYLPGYPCTELVDPQ